MTSSLLAAVLALALLTVLPGPDVAVVTRVALARGRAAATPTALGIVTGLLVWGLLAVAGLAALLAASAPAYAAVKVAGAVYLVWLGLQTLRHSRGGTQQHVAGSGVAGPFRTGLVSNLLNPKIAVFYTGLLPQLVPTGAPHAPTLGGLVVVHALLTLAWLGLYADLLTRGGRLLQRPRARRAVERVTGVVLVGLGARLIAA